MSFEWDEKKAEQNERKHGVAFTVATAVFSDPDMLRAEVLGSYGEHRWMAVGKVDGEVLVVVFTFRDGDVIRLISARKASRNERRRYYGNR